MVTAQKMKFSIKDFFSKCDQICRKLGSHLLEKSLMENFIFCVVGVRNSNFLQNTTQNSENIHEVILFYNFNLNKKKPQKTKKVKQTTPNVTLLAFDFFFIRIMLINTFFEKKTNPMILQVNLRHIKREHDSFVGMPVK